MRSSCRRGVQIAVALVLLIAGGGPVLSGSSAVPARPDDKTVLHVLNRVGFGPRPGEADRVRAMGLEKYIDEQLHPDRISDSAMEARLAGLDTLTMSPRSLADDYFLPAMRARAQAKKDVAQSGGTPQADSAKKERTPEQMRGAAKTTGGRRRALGTEDSSSGVQRPSARRGDDRLLVQPLQRLRRKRRHADVPDRVRARRHSAACVRQVSRSPRSHRNQSGDAVLSRQLAERRTERCASDDLPSVHTMRAAADRSRCLHRRAPRGRTTRTRESAASTRTTAAS